VITSSPWVPVAGAVAVVREMMAESDPALRAWLDEDTPETEASARAALIARGEPDPDAWLARWRATLVAQGFTRPARSRGEA
jgi:hypothetical protein